MTLKSSAFLLNDVTCRLKIKIRYEVATLQTLMIKFDFILNIQGFINLVKLNFISESFLRN